MNTNFSLLTDEQKTWWARDLWKNARNMSFVNKFLGSGPNSVIQHITELKKTNKGNRCVITLLADLEGDGTVGDRQLEGNEEAMKTYDQVIRYDQMRHANKHEGRMADQKSVVGFRENSRDVLAYWLADRIDQLAFLTLAGRSYTLYPNGATRVGSDFPHLEFAADVSPPTSRRTFRWNGTTKTLVAGGGTNTVTADDTPMWELFVQLKAEAKDRYIRGVKGSGGDEVFHAFLTPQAMAKLKLDPTYMLNVRSAQKRSETNPLFTGSSVEIDGIVFHEFRHVPNTVGMASGSKWGALGTIDGCQILFCGAQALGMADIGNPIWVEKGFDYDNQQGISIAKMVGFLKPKYNSIYDSNTVQDFSVLSVYVAQ